ncbi:hypothetical protein PIB30_050891 [Stylosanthes scabra]|uniref:Retrotransposon gag domain-containing protein n=1 Tax=Stylosanthes scabra TaxID=79078 RepID=A0ABU6WHC2_9FABA|nr:hypothetical protein [Stylosanthes scabra]
MLKAWFTPTTLATINIGTNNNNKRWTSMLRLMKPPEVATSMQNREEPRTGNRPLGIQPKAIDKAPSIGLDRADQTPDLSAERAMESEVWELRKENAELRSSTKDPQPRTRTSPRRRSRSPSGSPPRRNLRPSSSDSDSSSGRDRNPRRGTYRRYKRTRDRNVTPPIDGHTPFSSRILKVQPPKHFVKPTDMKYDVSTDPHIHLNDFEHRMICDGAVDAVKCWAFLTALTGLASQWFTSLPKPNETTRKYIERFNAECKTIDGLVDGVASLCLTNGLANDDFRKQLTTKPVWTRKEMQVISKEFIHREEVNRVVAATKNTQAHTAPRGSGQTSHLRDNHRDNGPRGTPKPSR